MDSMPQNQRRLAENDALVELIQTTEYLDDVPTWGQRDYRLYPLDMVILSTEEEVEEEVEVEEDENGFKKDKWIDLNGGFGRGFSQGNRIEVQQAPTDRSQPDRQGEDWSMPTNIERRENEIGRCENFTSPSS